MKKEIITLVQFFLITVLVGYGYFALVLIINGTAVLGLWHEYMPFLMRWILSFVVLSLIRFAAYYFVFRKGLNDSIRPTAKNAIIKEASTTIQYLIIAGVSIPISFYLFIFSFPPEISLNINQMWMSLLDGFLVWSIGFLMLSLIRLGIIHLKNKRFAEQMD
jgi:hypothetical protein